MHMRSATDHVMSSQVSISVSILLSRHLVDLDAIWWVKFRALLAQLLVCLCIVSEERILVLCHKER